MSRITDRIIQGGFLFLILSTPLMFGSVYPWAYSLLQVVAALMFGAWIFRVYILGKESAGGVPNAKMFFPVLLFFSVILLQLAPLPPGLLDALSPKTARMYETFLADTIPPDAADTQESSGINNEKSDGGSTSFVVGAGSQSDRATGNRSITLSKSRTREEALLVLTYFALFYLFVNYKPDGSVRAFLKRIVVCIAVTGALVATIGIVQKAFNPSAIYGFWQPLQKLRRPFMGPYVNANHFAGYIEMTLPLLLGLFLGWSGSLKKKGASSGIADALQSQENSKIALALTGLCLVMLALFLSFSRAGIVSFLLALLLFFFLLNRWERRFRPQHWEKTRGFRNVLLLSCVVVFGLLTLIIFALKVGGLEGLSTAARFGLWRDTWNMFQKFWAFGVGLGSFSVVSPYFKTTSLPFFFTHAENDYLQLLAETGIIGSFFIFTFFLVFFLESARVLSWRVRKFEERMQSTQADAPSDSQGRARRRYSDHTPGKKRPLYPLPRVNYYLVLGCVWSLTSLALHSFSDFNLHIPANGLLFFLLLALLYRLIRINQPLFSFSSGRNRRG